VPLKPDESVVIPIATFLAPLSYEMHTVRGVDRKYLNSYLSQEISHVQCKNLYEDGGMIGPAIWPNSIILNINKEQHEQQIHVLNLNRLYTLDTYVECGSCPHMFLENMTDGKLNYYGELISSKPLSMQHFKISIPKGIRRLVIAELEDETTFLENVKCDDELIKRSVRLEKGDQYYLEVKLGQSITGFGYYILKNAKYNFPSDPARKMKLVQSFIDQSK